MRKVLSILLISLFSISAFSQENEINKAKYLPALGGGIGLLSFQGDVGEMSSVSSFSNFRPAYNFTIEQRFSSLLGIQVGGTYGSIAKNERSSIRNLNFQSSLMGGELTMNIHFDNDLFTNRNLNFAPFFGGGAGYYMFDPYGDLLNENDIEYHYWSDGSIRDMEEIDENLGTATIISRDYDYETQLTASENYERSTIVFPIQVGLRFKINNSISANVSAVYYITQTDYIDNLKSGSSNDAFVSGKFSIMYHIGGMSRNDEGIYADIDFDAVDKEDDDGDGVKNSNDECPLTTKGIEVNGKGCPLDSDKDGVPDHLDKEENTEKNALVDNEGKTITEESLLKLFSDSLATDRGKIREEYPSLYGILVSDPIYPDENMLGDEFKHGEVDDFDNTSYDYKVNPNSKIPARFQEADFNKDEVITPDEIYKVIDGFFEGANNFDIDSIHDLIDYFFDQ